MSDWRWIRSPAGGPAFNMALDEAMLRIDPVRPTFRTYTWEPWTVSLGYFQEVPEEVVAGFRREGWGVVRRSTGGGAIFHGDELTYSLVCPANEPGMPRDALGGYDLVHTALARALERSGTPAETRGDRPLVSDLRDGLWCFYDSTEFDLVAGDRKLVGSAQRRSGAGFLQHGSIPTGPNPFTPEAAHAGVRPADLAPVFKDELARDLGATFSREDPTEDELALAARIAERKFGAETWTLRRRRAADREC